MNEKLKKLAQVHKDYLISRNLYDTKNLTWDQKRQCGIGGSDIGAICGVNSYKTAYDVYLDKTVGQSFHGNNITWFGSVFEHHMNASTSNAETIHGLTAILTVNSLILKQVKRVFWRSRPHAHSITMNGVKAVRSVSTTS